MFSKFKNINTVMDVNNGQNEQGLLARVVYPVESSKFLHMQFLNIVCLHNIKNKGNFVNSSATIVY